MSGGPGIQYKFSQTGIEDLTSKIKDLHQQFANGQITYKQYHSSMKEATGQGRAATQEFNEMKGAIAAANPNLLEFTRTMSLFGGVANTVLSVTNAINLAQLAGSGISTQLAQDQSQAAAAYNEYVKNLNAYGPADSRTVSAYNQYHALLNQITYDQQQLARESISTTATLIASGFAIAGSVAQTLIGFKALQAGMSATTAENFAIGLSAVGNAMMTIVAPIAIVIAGIEGIYQLIKLLDPAFADTANNLENSIMSNWHVDSIEAALLAPFVGFAGGVIQIGDEIYSGLVNWYNNLVNNIINPLINIWDNTVGNILGKIQSIGTISYAVPNANQILQGMGLGPNALGGSSSTSSNPNADAINKMLVGSPTSSTTALNTLQQNTLYSGTIAQGQQAANQYLNSILATGQAANQVAQQTLQSNQQQKDQINGLKASIIDNTNKITQLQQQPQTSLYAAHYDPDTGQPLYSTVPSDAANQIQQLQQQNAQSAAAIASAPTIAGGLDNMTSGLGPVLSSLGLDANTGIGSVISGALGSFAGIGGAGINAAQLAEFVKTHDYGVFTRAAIGDNTTNTPTHQQQIDALLKSWSGMGLSGYTAADAAKALGYATAGTSSGSSNVGSGAFGGLPGQYGNPGGSVFDGNTGIMAANGFEGMVTGPTHFLAGEAGPEAVSITPLSKGGGKGNVNVSVIVQGSLLAQNNFKDSVLLIFKEALKQGGFK